MTRALFYLLLIAAILAGMAVLAWLDDRARKRAIRKARQR